MQIGELREAGKIVPESSSVSRRIDPITGRLVAQATVMRPATARLGVDVEVIDDPEVVNAWCMAGGRMAIYTGLIQKLDPTDDELAQVHGPRDQPRAREPHGGAHVGGDRDQCWHRSRRRAVGRLAAHDEHGSHCGRARGQMPNSRTAEIGSRRDRHRARRQGRLQPERGDHAVAKDGRAWRAAGRRSS